MSPCLATKACLPSRLCSAAVRAGSSPTLSFGLTRPARVRPISYLARRCGNLETQSNSPERLKRRNFASPFRSFHATPSSFASVRDPYGVLGVSKSASSSDIKRAYYGAAKKYHPDTSQDPKAKDKFAEIQAAYEILSDPQKKQHFDQFGAAGFDTGAPGGPGAGPGSGPFSGGNPFGGGFPGFAGQGGFGSARATGFEDLFSAFSQQFGGAASGGGGASSGSRNLVGDNIETQVKISFSEASKGTGVNVNVRPLVACDACKGAGVRQGVKKSRCATCHGAGMTSHTMGSFQLQQTCSACGGSGRTMPPGSGCKPCGGRGVKRGAKTIKVDIPGGIEDGMRLRVDGEGDAPIQDHNPNPDAYLQPGDLYIIVRVEADHRFKRSGSDILYTATIPPMTAMLGGDISVPTLEGETKVKVPTGTSTGDVKVLYGMGMRKLNGGGRLRSATGDLKVEFKVNMPKYLSPNQRVLLEMLADELGDKTANRVMNVGSKSHDPNNPESHKHQGFLKSMWSNLTNHPSHEPHDSGSSSSQSDSGGKDGEKKSGSGSG